MGKIFSFRPYIILSVALILYLVATTAFAAEPPRRPKIPEPLSPIFPSPGIQGIPQRGDPQRGKRIYQSWGCPSCHTLDGKGGKIGPDLARAGEIHTDPYWFRRYLADPRGIIPNSVKPPVRLSDPDMDDLIAYLMSLKKFR